MLRPALDDERLDRIVRLAMKQTNAEAGLLLLLITLLTNVIARVLIARLGRARVGGITA